MKNISALLPGKLRLLLISFSVTLASSTAIALSYPATDSPLSTGRWVKVKVTQTGMQQITFDQLSQWGFANPEKVHVYGFGGALYWNNFMPLSIPQDLPLQYSEIDGNRIIFYGESQVRGGLEYLNSSVSLPVPERNIIADAGYYFLSEVEPEEEISPLPLRPISGATLVKHESVEFMEEELTKPSGYGLNYFGRPLSTWPDETLTYDVEFPDMAASSRIIFQFPLAITDGPEGYKGVARVTFPGRTSPHVISMEMPSRTLHKVMTTTGSPSAYRYYLYAPNFPDEPKGTFTISPDATNYAEEIYPDFVAVKYTRTNNFGGARNGQLRMLMSSGVADNRIAIYNATPTMRVWDIASANAVAPYELSEPAADGTVYVTVQKNFNLTKSLPGGGIIAFDSDAEFYGVEYAGEVANSNLHAMEVPDFLIITSELLRPEAERLADLHREYLDQKVAVVGLEEIYNEFSSGTPALNGIRRFISKLYWRPESPLKHVLLFGVGSNDPKGIGNSALYIAENNYIPTYSTTTYAYMSSNVDGYSSDAYFGHAGESLFSEQDLLHTPMFVSVGRIPATDLEQAAIAVDKIREYLAVPPTMDAVNRTLILTDPAENLGHQANGESVATYIKSGRRASTIVKAYVPLFPLISNNAYSPLTTTAIVEALKTGVNFFDFSGHGAYNSFTKTQVWTKSDIRNTRYTNYPIGFFATCDSYSYDILEPSMAGAMLFQPEGGIIAGIGTARSTWTTCNQTINSTVAKLYAEAEPGTTIGDIYRLMQTAHYNSTTDGMDRVVANYNLCGDPALPVKTPYTDRITLGAINSSPIVEGLDYEIIPLTTNTLTGSVLTQRNGSVDTSFNGTLYLNVYEVPRDQLTSDGDKTAVVNLDSDLLFSVEAPVNEGRFTLTFTSPLPARVGNREGTYDSYHNRATILAVSDDNRRYYSHNMSNFIVSADVPTDIADVNPAEIHSIYIDTPEFADGDNVAPDFTLKAHFTPGDGGLKMTSGNIGGVSTFTIDESTTYKVLSSMVKTQPDGTAILSIPVDDLADGRHTGRLSIIDNFDNSTSATIHFNVISSPVAANLSVVEDVARVQATFNLLHSFGDAPKGRIIVEDAAGNVVWSKEDVVFPCEWDLTSGGRPVADGVYRAYAILRSGILYATTPTVNFTVVQSTH